MNVRTLVPGLLLLIALGVAIAVWSSWSVGNARRSALTDLQIAAEGSAARIGHALRALELVMRTVSVHVVATQTREGLQPYLKQLTGRLPPVRTVTVISPDGVIRTDLRSGEPAKGYQVADRAYFRAHMPPDIVADYFYSPPIKSRLDGLTQITLSLAARQVDGALASVVVSSIDDRFFGQLGESLKVLARYDARIVYKDHREVYTLHELKPVVTDREGLAGFMLRLFDADATSHHQRIAISHTDFVFQLSLPTAVYVSQAVPDIIRGSLVLCLVALLLVAIWLLAYRAGVQKQESERRFRDFAVSASDWFWEMDENLRFTYFSDRFEEITRVPPEALLGRTREETGIPGVDAADFARHLDDLHHHRPFRMFEHTREYEDGSIRYLAINGQPRFDKDGRFLGYRGTGTDNTEKRVSEEKFRITFDHLALGNIIIDESGTVEAFNSAAETIFGYTRDEVIGRNVKMLMPEPIRGAHNGYLRRYQETGEATVIGVGRETTGLRKNGKEFPMQLSVGESKAGVGQTFIGSVVDLTDRKALEEQLFLAQRMEAVGQLTGGIAHDFNNLLGVIIGNLDFLEENLQGQPELLEFVDSAVKSALYGADLNRQLLAFSRKQKLTPELIDLNDHVLSMLDMLRRTLGETIEIEARQGEGPWTTEADPAQVESAILNLAVNARDAMPEGGTLTIEIQKVTLGDAYAATQQEVTPGVYVKLSIADTGTGIPQRHMAHVFDPFFTTKDVGKGTGLGLSMVYGFAKQSGGHVEIESGDARGTTVNLYLPYLERPSVADLPETEITVTAQGETILLVEDNEALLRLTANLLRDLGYGVLEATDAEKALAVLESGRSVDLLLTDVVMPGGMAGPALAAAVVAKYPAVKVLYMSGYTPNAVNHSDQLDENAPFLQKPFRKPELANTIRALLNS